jgi:hypothetical protein
MCKDFLDMIATTPPQLFVPCGSKGYPPNTKIQSKGDDRVGVVFQIKYDFERLADPIYGDFRGGGAILVHPTR